MQIPASTICLCKGSVMKEISNLVQEIGKQREKAARLIRDDGDKNQRMWERSVEQINNVGTLRRNEVPGANIDPGQEALWKWDWREQEIRGNCVWGLFGVKMHTERGINSVSVWGQGRNGNGVGTAQQIPSVSLCQELRVGPAQM